ncbi:hypothetical protein [Gulbenkiania mobilis]|uniref:hypothetical protein n=1 Tax=Gulbenkiania mobilis TaxID=397457 RepID=UPI00128F007E|nr:hypothetical protein [Gulbenkiania mobilis]
MFDSIESIKRDLQATSDKFISRLLTFLAIKQDDLRPEVLITGEKAQVVLIAPHGDVIWRIQPNFQLNHHRDGDREFWTPAWQTQIDVVSANAGDSFKQMLYGDEFDNAIHELVSKLLVREPFVQYAWVKDTHDPLKFRLFADGEKMDAVWKSGRIWGTTNGNSYPTRQEAMQGAMSHVLMFSATRLLEQMTANAA